MKSNPPLYPDEVGFHRRRRFHPPERVDLVEKPTCRNKSVFLVGAGGFEPPKSKTTDLQSAPFGHSGTLPYLIVAVLQEEKVELVDGLEPPTC